nr:hypothetical protein [Thioalkalivibrio nitratireducens]
MPRPRRHSVWIPHASWCWTPWATPRRGAYAVRHFERAGLAPIPAPTGFKTGSERVRTLAYWLPSAGNLRKTERAVQETLGLLALELDHLGR